MAQIICIETKQLIKQTEIPENRPEENSLAKINDIINAYQDLLDQPDFNPAENFELLAEIEFEMRK